VTVAPVAITADSRLSHDVLAVAPPQVDLNAIASGFVTTPLGPLGEQQFTATAAGQTITPAWRLRPPDAGSVDDAGRYRAPAAITALQGSCSWPPAGRTRP
jgi:hypothetical protein